MRKIIIICMLALLLTACNRKIDINEIEDIPLENIKLVESLSPQGFTGSSLNKIELYSNGEVYWIQHDGVGFEKENIIKKELIAKNCTEIKEDDEGGIIITGDGISNEVGWIKFNKINENNTDKVKIPEYVINEYINVINTIEDTYLDEEIRYDLIYFNNDYIPDLVATKQGYWVSLYLFDDSKTYDFGIHNPIDQWGYGAGGNSGYDYIEKSGIIINNNADYAGAIMTKSYFILNSNYEFDVLSNTFLGSEISKEDEEYELVMDAFESYGGYYYNNEKISEEVYNEKIKNIEKDDMISKIMTGEKEAEEIIKDLENIIL